SSIGVTSFHFCVRDVIWWVQFSMVIKKFWYRIVPCGALQQIGYVIAGKIRDRKPSVSVMFTDTAI
ncbi:hypothetical protein RA271_30385, partial [Pseudomonas syringae pv. tagetis]